MQRAPSNTQEATAIFQYFAGTDTASDQNYSLAWYQQTMHTAVINMGGDPDVILTESNRLGLKTKRVWLIHALQPTSIEKTFQSPQDKDHTIDEPPIDRETILTTVALATYQQFAPGGWFSEDALRIP